MPSPRCTVFFGHVSVDRDALAVAHRSPRARSIVLAAAQRRRRPAWPASGRGCQPASGRSSARSGPATCAVVVAAAASTPPASTAAAMATQAKVRTGVIVVGKCLAMGFLMCGSGRGVARRAAHERSQVRPVPRSPGAHCERQRLCRVVERQRAGAQARADDLSAAAHVHVDRLAAERRAGRVRARVHDPNRRVEHDRDPAFVRVQAQVQVLEEQERVGVERTQVAQQCGARGERGAERPADEPRRFAAQRSRDERPANRAPAAREPATRWSGSCGRG